MKKKKTIPLYWMVVGSSIIFYNQLYALASSFGIEMFQLNLMLMFIVLVAAVYFTPYLDAIVRG